MLGEIAKSRNKSRASVADTAVWPRIRPDGREASVSTTNVIELEKVFVT